MEIKKWFNIGKVIEGIIFVLQVLMGFFVGLFVYWLIFVYSWDNNYARVLEKRVIEEKTYIKCLFGDGSIKEVEFLGKEQFNRLNINDEVKVDYTIGGGWSCFAYRE